MGKDTERAYVKMKMSNEKSEINSNLFSTRYELRLFGNFPSIRNHRFSSILATLKWIGSATVKPLLRPNISENQQQIIKKLFLNIKETQIHIAEMEFTYVASIKIN